MSTNVRSGGGNPSPTLTEQTVDLLKDLREAVEGENHDKTIKTIAPSLLFEDRLDPNRDDEAIVMAVYDIYVKALLEQGEFDQVVQLLSQQRQSKQHNRKQGQKIVVPDYVTQKLEAARVYAMYRLERYEAAKQAAAEALKKASLSGDETPQDVVILLQHIEAQSLYHMQDYGAAFAVYSSILEQQQQQDGGSEGSGNSRGNNTTTTETLQLLNNVVALSCAHMIPFMRSVDALAAHRSQITDVLEDQSNQKSNDDAVFAEYAHDLAYNVATYDLCTAGHDRRLADKAHAFLQDAIQRSRDTGEVEGWTEEKVSKEVATAEWNMEWSRLLWQGGTTPSSSVPSSKNSAMATRMVALANQALNTTKSSKASDAVRLLPKPSDKMFVPLQNNLLWYNRAVLLYRADQIEECQKTCEEWAHCIQVTSSSKNNKKKKTQQLPEQTSQNGATKIRILMSPDESMFWSSRITVLECLCLARKGQTEAALRRIDTQLEVLAQSSSSSSAAGCEADSGDDINGHLILYLQTHRALFENSEILSSEEKMIHLLQALPESMQKEKAVVATMASLYHKQGKEDKANIVLKESGNEEALADFLLTQGRYQEVVDLCKDRNDSLARARYIQALSYVDPERAHLEWTSLEPELVLTQDDASVANGAELELKELPRLKSQKSRTAASGSSAGLAEATSASGTKHTNKKSHEAVLRRRARKREEYLAELEEKKSPLRTQMPDPERWLPKYERSYNRRRRNRQNQQQHKGAQGGVSEKDAAKLDVAARQQAARNNNNNDVNNNNLSADGERSTAHMSAVSSNGPQRKGRRRN